MSKVDAYAIAESITKCVRVLYEVGNTDRDIVKKAIFNELSEALSLKGEEVPYDDIRAIANREVQEVMNQGAKLSSEEQFALNELFIELGEVFYSKLQHSTPSPNPLLEEVKKRLLKLPPIGWDSPTADVLRQEYTDLIQFSEGGKNGEV